MQVWPIGYWRCAHAERAYRISRTAAIWLHGTGRLFLMGFSGIYLEISSNSLDPCSPWGPAPPGRPRGGLLERWHAGAVTRSSRPFQCSSVPVCRLRRVRPAPGSPPGCRWAGSGPDAAFPRQHGCRKTTLRVRDRCSSRNSLCCGYTRGSRLGVQSCRSTPYNH